MKTRMLQLAFIAMGICVLVWLAQIPAGYVETEATVTAHRRATPEVGSDLVAEVEFRDLKGMPREERTRDEIIWGQPAVGQKIKIHYDAAHPSTVRIDAPLNRLGKLYILAAFIFTGLIFASFIKTRNEN